jgi:hypothetical protein
LDVQDAWALARSAPAGVPEREAALREALVSFGGVLAEEAGYEWHARYQEQSRRFGVAIHRRLAEVVASNDPRQAAQLLDGACDLDPFDESLAQQAVQSVSGDPR